MSGPKISYYVISAAVAALLARQAAAARAQQIAAAERTAALRDWAAVGARHAALRQRAARLRGSGAAVPDLATPVTNPAASTADIRAGVAAATTAADRVEAELTELERSALRQRSRRAVANVLGAVNAPSGPAAPAARPGPARPAAPVRQLEQDLETADRLLARMAGGAARPPGLTAILDELPAADPARRRLLLDQLRVDVRQANAAAAAAAELATARTEAELALARTDDDQLRAVLAAPHTDAAALRSAAAAADSRAAQARERQHVQRLVVDVFGQLGYDVAAGFDVHTPQDQLLVPRGPAASHGVEVRVHDGVLNLAAVRLADGGGAAHTDADLVAERELCAAASKVWDRLREQDVALSGITGVPVGKEVPRTRRLLRPAPQRDGSRPVLNERAL